MAKWKAITVILHQSMACSSGAGFIAKFQWVLVMKCSVISGSRGSKEGRVGLRVY